MRRTAWLSTAAAAALLMTIATVSASAQFNYRPSEQEIYRLAQRNGYQQGFREGRQDRRSGDGFDFKRNRAYRDGKWGFRNEYRHDETYRDGFRNGFAQGYREGYNGNGGWDRRDNYRWDRDSRGRRNNPWWDRNDRNSRNDDWRWRN